MADNDGGQREGDEVKKSVYNCGTHETLFFLQRYITVNSISGVLIITRLILILSL